MNLLDSLTMVSIGILFIEMALTRVSIFIASNQALAKYCRGRWPSGINDSFPSVAPYFKQIDLTFPGIQYLGNPALTFDFRKSVIDKWFDNHMDEKFVNFLDQDSD